MEKPNITQTSSFKAAFVVILVASVVYLFRSGFVAGQWLYVYLHS